MGNGGNLWVGRLWWPERFKEGDTRLGFASAERTRVSSSFLLSWMMDYEYDKNLDLVVCEACGGLLVVMGMVRIFHLQQKNYRICNLKLDYKTFVCSLICFFNDLDYDALRTLDSGNSDGVSSMSNNIILYNFIIL